MKGNCPLCTKPISRIGYLAVFKPKGGGRAIPYALCRECSVLMGHSSAQESRRLVETIEVNLIVHSGKDLQG